jgi:polysaccharide deacetylase family protein (PEP-CTERM system associated)
MKTLLSIDVEDWFQVENLKQAIDKDSWGDKISRIDRNINLILDLLKQKDVKATFFVLGWIAERYPSLIKKIHNVGHEIACHGYNHELVYTLSPEKFLQDVSKAKNILEDITGENIIGYRAPSFSITNWAFDILISLGFKYDSSLFLTITHNRYGKLTNFNIPKNAVFEIKKGFYQVKLSSLDLWGIKLPWSGGFYFRFIPYTIFKYGIKEILRKKGVYLFYIHPWEFDPEQPRVNNIKLNYKLRHYTNLTKTADNFKKLLVDFDFCPIKEAILHAGMKSGY